jgi:hypothetical protein
MLCFKINRGLCRAPANRQNTAAMDTTQVPSTAFNTIGREPRVVSLQWLTLPSGQLLVVLVRPAVSRDLHHLRRTMAKVVDLCRPLARGSTWERDGPRAWQCLAARCIHAGVHQEKAGTASSCPNAAAARSFLTANVTSTHLPQANSHKQAEICW